MKLIFNCPQVNRIFESDAYRVEDNRGVIQDQSGNRILDAKVVLTEPCPFCGRLHGYPAGELACPLGDI